MCDIKGQADAVRLLLDWTAVPSPDQTQSVLAAVRQRRLQSPLTPLHWAADGGHGPCVSLLLGVDEWRRAADRPTTEPRNVGDFSAAGGTTPLMLAARAGSADVVRQIVDVVGDVLVVDRQDDNGQLSLNTHRNNVIALKQRNGAPHIEPQYS